MQEFLIAFTSISFLILTLSLVYKKLKRIYLSEPIIAMAVEMLMGSHVLMLMDINNWGAYEQKLK